MAEWFRFVGEAALAFGAIAGMYLLMALGVLFVLAMCADVLFSPDVSLTERYLDALIWCLESLADLAFAWAPD